MLRGSLGPELTLLGAEDIQGTLAGGTPCPGSGRASHQFG